MISDNGLKVITIIMGSSLVLELYKDIREWIKKRSKRDLDGKIEAMSQSLDKLTVESKEQFTSMRKKLDEDREHLQKVDTSLEQIKDKLNKNAKGTMLGLENDVVIFKALREHKINGESEEQERKMMNYSLECAEQTFKIGE